MDWGMKNRLSRLIQKDGKALFLPVDHGYFQGPTHGLREARKNNQTNLPVRGCNNAYTRRFAQLH